MFIFILIKIKVYVFLMFIVLYNGVFGFQNVEEDSDVLFRDIKV